MNRTIDDTYGDPITGRQVEYSSNWHAGQNCSVCTLSPSQAQAVEGTWHDTTSNNPNSTTPHTATIRFNGTAIWVYGIVVNYASQGIIIFTNASFELDGISLKNFEHEPQPEQDQYIYNVLLSSETGLDDTEHTLVMSAVQGANTSLLLFDYAVYTYDDSKPSSASNTLSMTSTSSLSPATTSNKPTSSSTNDLKTHHGISAGGIAGSVVAGTVAFILLLTAGILCFRQRQRRMPHLGIQAKHGDQTLVPFVLSPEPDHSDKPSMMALRENATEPSLPIHTPALDTRKSQKRVTTLRGEQAVTSAPTGNALLEVGQYPGDA